MNKARSITTAVLCLLLATPAWAGYDEGKAAYARGDYATALRELRPLAERGDADAQYHLGNMYRYGWGVLIDHAEALWWYRKAAEQGHAAAQDSIGDMYRSGYGVPQHYAEAVKWYRKAAEQGDGRAQSNLGEMYRDGHGVQQDYVQAHMWLNLAGAQGFNVGSKEDIAKKMTPAQITDAQKLAAEWWAAFQKPSRALRESLIERLEKRMEPKKEKGK